MLDRLLDLTAYHRLKRPGVEPVLFGHHSYLGQRLLPLLHLVG